MEHTLHSERESNRTTGQLIVIDGTDGAGKATQTRRLVERLRAEGARVETLSFPQYHRPSSGSLKSYLAGDYGTIEQVSPYVGSLLFAVDRYDGSFEIRQWLSEGAIVVADRYVSSNMGHQGSKIADPTERSAYLAWDDHLEFTLCGLPRPTITIVLAMPSDISYRLAREGAAEKFKVRGDIHEHSMEHLRASEATYREIAAAFPNMHLLECAPSGTLRTVEDIHEEIWQTLTARVQFKHHAELLV